jgi:hypothetical protein
VRLIVFLFVSTHEGSTVNSSGTTGLVRAFLSYEITRRFLSLFFFFLAAIDPASLVRPRTDYQARRACKYSYAPHCAAACRRT